MKNTDIQSLQRFRGVLDCQVKALSHFTSVGIKEIQYMMFAKLQGCLRLLVHGLSHFKSVGMKNSDIRSLRIQRATLDCSFMALSYFTSVGMKKQRHMEFGYFQGCLRLLVHGVVSFQICWDEKIAIYGVHIGLGLSQIARSWLCLISHLLR